MKRAGIVSALIILSLLLVVACKGTSTETGTNGQAETDTGADTDEELKLSSTAFGEGDDIPFRYSCDGEDISPELTWDSVPVVTQSFVLIMDDPDAPGGVFTHWVLFNIPADARQLPEAIPNQQELSSGARHGINDFGDRFYGGPCPPFGLNHRYQFTLYALDTTLDLPVGASKQQVLDAMQGHVSDSVTLTGMYQS